jgi:hypothetical protein
MIKDMVFLQRSDVGGGVRSFIYTRPQISVVASLIKNIYSIINFVLYFTFNIIKIICFRQSC